MKKLLLFLLITIGFSLQHSLMANEPTLPMSSHTQPIRTPDATACTSLGAQTGTHGTPSVRNARSYEANMPADGTANECCHLI